MPVLDLLVKGHEKREAARKRKEAEIAYLSQQNANRDGNL